MGQLQTIEVPALEGAELGTVEAGESWCFQAKGRWWDGVVPCGPDGYRFFLADVLDFYPVNKDRPLFELTAQVVGHDEFYPIGRSATVTFRQSGVVRLFANDVPGFEKNNRGALTVEHGSSDCPAPPADDGRHDGLPGLWTQLRDTLDKTRGVASAAVLSVGVCAALAFVQQGQDLVRTVAEDSFFSIQQVLFALTLLFLAVQAWIWPRMIIAANYGRDRDIWRPRRFLEWTPRVLGALPFVLVTIAVWQNPARNTGLVAALVAIGVIFFIAIIKQYDMRRAFRAHRGGGDPLKVGRAWVISSAVLGVAGMIWATFWPVGFGWTLGAPAVVLLGVGCIIPAIAVLVQTGQAARVPALPALLVVATIFSLWVDNHAVGWRAPTTPILAAPKQLALEQAYDLWARQAPVAADGNRVMVLVASEGGASRAGYWTAEVLGALHESTRGTIDRNLFAISSVSGGSVGAVGYAATLQDRSGLTPTEFRDAVTRFAGHDFLSPTIGGLLFPDLLQRFLPVAVMPDRAQGLEQAFAAGWRETCAAGPGRCATPDLLSGGFARLTPDGKTWRPIVIVNGASEELGRRILTSRVRFSPPQVDADDFYEVVNRDVPASTAIHNGARFPWVSPAGTLTQPSGKALGHIVDGGYFDGAGVEVLRELDPTLRAIAARRGDKLRIVFIYIGYRERVTEALESAETKPPERTTDRVLNEVLAPLRAVFSSRSAHAGHLLRELKVQVSGNRADIDPTTYSSTPQAHYEPVLLCKKSADRRNPAIVAFEPPMDWALSECARLYMRKATGAGLTEAQRKVCSKVLDQPLPCQSNVTTALARIVRQADGGPPEPPPGAP